MNRPIDCLLFATCLILYSAPGCPDTSQIQKIAHCTESLLYEPYILYRILDLSGPCTKLPCINKAFHQIMYDAHTKLWDKILNTAHHHNYIAIRTLMGQQYTALLDRRYPSALCGLLIRFDNMQRFFETLLERINDNPYNGLYQYRCHIDVYRSIKWETHAANYEDFACIIKTIKFSTLNKKIPATTNTTRSIQYFKSIYKGPVIKIIAPCTYLSLNQLLSHALTHSTEDNQSVNPNWMISMLDRAHNSIHKDAGGVKGYTLSVYHSKNVQTPGFIEISSNT